MVDVELALTNFESRVNLDELASLKTVVAGIIRIINDPHATVKELKEVIVKAEKKKIVKRQSSKNNNENTINELEHLEKKILI